jgi:microtubule-associated protein-like 6
VRVVRAHAPGPQVLREDGPPTFHGVRCLRLRADLKTLLSAGADGHVIKWDVSGGDLKEGSVLGATPVKSPYQGASTGPNGPAAPVFRGLDCMPGSEVFIAGTHRSDIWEIDDTPEVLIYGHSADLYGVAWDPTNPTVFATASEVGWHFSPRYYCASKHGSIDASQHGPLRNQSGTREWVQP